MAGFFAYDLTFPRNFIFQFPLVQHMWPTAAAARINRQCLGSNCLEVIMADTETASVAATTTDIYGPTFGDADMTETVVDLEDDSMCVSLDCVALKTRIMEDVSEVLDRFATPTQYLASIARPEFAEWLWDTFPEADEVLYHHKAHLPSCTEDEISSTQPLLIHIAALGMDKTCSLKPPPGKAQCTSLCEQFLTEGFLSNTAFAAPLLVLPRVLPEDTSLPDLWRDSADDLAPFSLGYLKGMTRASSLLLLVHRIFVCKIDVAKDLPTLHRSILRIQVLYVKTGTRVDEALTNMKMSCRGSLIKATNTLQAVVMIKNLCSMGLTNHMQFVRRWNQMASSKFQFTGKRFTALKLLFEETPEARWDLQGSGN